MQKSIFKIHEIEVVYNTNIKPSERPQIKSSTDAEKLFRDNWDRAKIEYCEEFKIMLLNHSNRLLGINKISQGGTGGTVIDLKRIFGVVLKCNASAIILVHNHPSGNKKPSEADMKITKKIEEAGKLLGINVLDHLILTPDSYYSMSDNK